jgi:hypothetical protein
VNYGPFFQAGFNGSCNVHLRLPVLDIGIPRNEIIVGGSRIQPRSDLTHSLELPITPAMTRILLAVFLFVYSFRNFEVLFFFSMLAVHGSLLLHPTTRKSLEKKS